ncbi:LacI family DNA-binding transcriptional regulator [Arthrobacter sp. NPDC080031]|uniref:LacI family DNA-binding transcriptional regulator n=1 Tax=Arthrobacter sp. NPDC080031 TaxID=3155918 RepID=UPI00344E790A
MITQEEVAREAGTSTAVVSYVVNNGPRKVSDATRKRVLDAVERLGYRPNAVARSLRSASSTTLGLIAADITNPYCGEVAQAVETSALERGYSLLLGNAMQNDERQAKHLRTFIEQQVKGIIFAGSSVTNEAFLPATMAALKGNKTPVVFLDRSASEVWGTSIIVDNRAGAFAGTTHLLDHGHTEVASFSGPLGLSAVRERQEGWEQALIARGIDPDGQLNVQSSFDRYDAFRVAKMLLATRKRPRAMFVHSDEQAIGILHAAAEARVRVPEDVALVSFDGIREAGIISPGLTTVQQPIARAGSLAVDLLLRARPGEAMELQSEMLPVELIIRHSCGCA